MLARLEKTKQLLMDENKTEKELLVLYKNFNQKMAHVSKSEFDEVKEAYENLMDEFQLCFRDRFPKAAKHLYGAKDAEVRAQLEHILNRIKIKYDVSGNVVANHVKTGGDMMAGRSYLSVYISYKNLAQKCVFLGAYQAHADSPLLWRVRTYTAYLQPSDELQDDFPALEIENAQTMYEEKLRDLI